MKTILAALIATASVGTLSGCNQSGDQAKSAQQPSADSCLTSMVTVKNLLADTSEGNVRVTGTIHNGCNVAVGAQVKMVFKYESGSAYSDAAWPASVSNIDPGSDYQFEWAEDAHGTGDLEVSASVVSVRQW